MAGLTNSLIPPRDLGRHHSLLDVGCGIRPQNLIAGIEHYLGIDAHRPYVDRMEDPDHFLCSHWQPALAELGDHEFDVCTALDFIEHLEKEEGHEFLTEAQRVAKLVVIFTPVGPFPQPFADPDQWGMDGGYWQTHRSAWTPEDFDGWEIHVWSGCIVVDGHLNPLPAPLDAFWAIKETP